MNGILERRNIQFAQWRMHWVAEYNDDDELSIEDVRIKVLLPDYQEYWIAITKRRHFNSTNKLRNGCAQR